eukprot:TRINITY_DN3676_c0_g2_i1.p1 TRINITY_DN3676_c0_g2~~TRINITY_DN3676_c0_g2_i1.p1  ORF type:complete len:382 (-),score=-27.10 TRINITY_DN3676_c0_g2_i1:76-1221(-)
MAADPPAEPSKQSHRGDPSFVDININRTTPVSITVLSARDLHNTKKLFGHMNPCALVSIPAVFGADFAGRSGGNLPPPPPPASKLLASAPGGGTNPSWGPDNTFRVDVDDRLLQIPLASQSTSPPVAVLYPPCATVEVFSSASLRKPLGFATVPLDPAIRRYDEAQQGELPLYRSAGAAGGAALVQAGWVLVKVVVGRASFAPAKGSAVYDAFLAAGAAVVPSSSSGGAPPPPSAHYPPTSGTPPAPVTGFPAYVGPLPQVGYNSYGQPPPPAHSSAGPYAPQGPPPPYGAQQAYAPYTPPAYNSYAPPQTRGYSAYGRPPVVVRGHGHHHHRHHRRGMGGAGGLGAGLLLGGLGGLIVGDAIGDTFDSGFGDFGGFDMGF